MATLSMGPLLHSRAGPQALAAARIWFFGAWFLKILIHPVGGVARLPAEIHTPLSFVLLIPDSVTQWLWSPAGLITLKIVLLLTCAAASIGVLARPAMIAAAAGLTLYVASMTGIATFVDHIDLTLLLATWILAASPCLDAWVAVGKPRPGPSGPRYGAPLVAMLLLQFASYMFAGTNRLLFGIPGALKPGSMALITVLNAHAEPGISFGVAEALAGYPLWGWSLSIGTVFITLMEISAPLALVNRRYRLLFAAVMIPFHISTVFLFTLRFWSPILFYVLFVDFRFWQALWRRVRRSRERGDP